VRRPSSVLFAGFFVFISMRAIDDALALARAAQALLVAEAVFDSDLLRARPRDPASPGAAADDGLIDHGLRFRS